MNNGNHILSIESLATGYGGSLVLRGLSLTLQSGETGCVIGEEGSGKSTLVKAITRQLRSTGKITYNGIDLRSVPTEKMTRHGIDFIAQGGNILKGLTVEEHICLALAEKGAKEKRLAWQDVEELFPKLIALRKQVAGRLSGGERMILSIACVLATDAGFLVLDEPTAGLAPETCEVIKGFLLRMKEERGKTILVMEHNYEFAFAIADSVVTLRDGRLSEKYLADAFTQADFVDTRLYALAS